MDAFIEVIGDATLTESVAEYRVELTITARASLLGTAQGEVAALRDRCIRALLGAGLHQDELSEGGRAAWQPWYAGKQTGQEAAHKILVACIDASRLYSALDALEPLFDKQRTSLSVSMQAPRFEAQDGAHAAAQIAAITHAREKAEVIATEAGVSLQRIVQVEELTSATERSGVYGDNNWGGLTFGETERGAAPHEAIGDATRQKQLRFRVRFAIA